MGIAARSGLSILKDEYGKEVFDTRTEEDRDIAHRFNSAIEKQSFWRNCRPANPVGRIERAERRVVLDLCLNELTDANLEVYWLRFQCGMSFAQIGVYMETSEDAAAQMSHYVVRRLREILAAKGFSKRAHI